MALNTLNKNTGRNINYLNKDFTSFRDNLIKYTKTYFPKTNTDFNESSPGMMFIEMASYLGDVLGYYIDDTLKESLITTATDRENVVALANFLGYKPKVVSPAITTLSVYQLVPSKSIIGNDSVSYEPDPKFYLRINEGMLVESTDSGTTFITTEMVDFSDSNDREVSIYQRDSLGKPEYYLIKKLAKVMSGVLKETEVTANSTVDFQKFDLSETNIIDIFDVRDDNGNKWYEVPYLAQELVYTDYSNSEQTDKNLSQFKESVPNILKVTKTSRRFVKQINSDNTTSIVFGGGVNSNDETLIPNFKNVGLGLNSSIDTMNSSFDPSNFLKTRSYGQSPNGRLVIKYIVGGGVSANIPQGQLVKIENISFDEDVLSFDESELSQYNFCKNSIATDNELPATGGRGPETIDEIRENALANFGSQNRAVTRNDYQVRALSMPAKYGSIAKVYCAPDGELDNNSPASILSNPNSLQQFTDLVTSLKEKDLSEDAIKSEVNTFLLGKQTDSREKNNPFAINLYILGYNQNKNLISVGDNAALLENLKTYLSEYRLLTDGVNLLNGFIINVGVDFEIRVYGGYNKQEVLVKCITEIKKYFNIDSWTFNMPINISELELLIAGVEGVQSVPKCDIVNKCKGNYAATSYNIEAATKNKMVYPSLDPSVFEVKYPNKDIQGRVV